MNLLLANKNKLAIVFGVVIAISLIAGTYFFYLNPKIARNEQDKSNLKAQQTLLSAIENNINKQNDLSNENSATLQKIIPVKPLTEQLLFTIEKAETVSSSTVQNMVFSDGVSDLSSETGLLNEKVEESTTLENETTDESAATEEQEEDYTIELPSGMKQLTVDLEIEAKDYFSLEKFIQTMESGQRALVIQNINYLTTGEKTKIAKTKELLSFRITFSVFYMPTLTDLQESIPKLEIPEPSNKINPLNN